MKVASVSNEIVEMCAESAFTVIEEMSSDGDDGPMAWKDLPTQAKQKLLAVTRRVLTENVTAQGFKELMGGAKEEPLPPPLPRSDGEDGERANMFDEPQTSYGPDVKAVVFVATVKVCYFCATGSRG